MSNFITDPGERGMTTRQLAQRIIELRDKSQTLNAEIRGLSRDIVRCLPAGRCHKYLRLRGLAEDSAKATSAWLGILHDTVLGHSAGDSNG